MNPYSLILDLGLLDACFELRDFPLLDGFGLVSVLDFVEEFFEGRRFDQVVEGS